MDLTKKYVGKVAYNRQRNMEQTYDAIIEFASENGHTPTIAELSRHMNLTTGAINKRMDHLYAHDERIERDKKNGQIIVLGDWENDKAHD